jgi:hypothetical protein
MTLLSGRYRLGDVVYGDATIAVHKGFDQLLNRAVTIELVRAGRPDDQTGPALRDKGRRMATRELPHVAALYDQGDEAGQSYLIYEEMVGAPLSVVAPLQPSEIVTLIGAVATTLRIARRDDGHVPRLDPSSVRFGEGRVQIINWGLTPEPTDDLAALTTLLALAATGSERGHSNVAVAPPVMRVVRQALDGQFTSVDHLKQELCLAAARSEEQTMAIPRAGPTLLVTDQRGGPRPSAQANERRRRPILWSLIGLLILLGLAGGSLWLRERLAVGDPQPDTGQIVAEPEVGDEPTPPMDAEEALPRTPYVVSPVGQRRLNVRSDPGEDAPVIGRLTRGTVVDVIGEPVQSGSYNWVRVEAEGISGWCILEGLRPQ